MRRSVLFTPGDRPDRLGKAWRDSIADVVVADLEDAVAPAHKDDARAHVARLLATASTSEKAVRINPFPRGKQDLEALLGAGVQLILVPKADMESLAVIAKFLAEWEGGAMRAAPPILAILETAVGVLEAGAIAALPRVVAVALGAEDLAADAGMRRTESNDEVAYARGHIALAAAAAGKDAIDMISATLQDDRRLRREATEARNMGFAGKMCIHPSQVAVIHAAWTPSPQEIEWAQAVVHAGADLEGGGVAVVAGKMVDVPLLRQARRILADAGGKPKS